MVIDLGVFTYIHGGMITEVNTTTGMRGAKARGVNQRTLSGAAALTLAPSVVEFRRATSAPAVRSQARPKISGKLLQHRGERFLVKGVTYGTFRANEDGEPYPSMPQMREDFAQMLENGINTIRLYTPPSDRMADLAAEMGLYLIADICWGPRTCEWDYRAWWSKAVEGTAEQAKRLGNHPAMLMLSIGNEIPPLMVRWYGRKRTESYLRCLYDTVKEHAPDSIVTYVNHPPTEYLHLPFLDVLSFNIYLNREKDLRGYLARLHNLAGDRPLFLGELGFDSQEFGPEGQAKQLEVQLRIALEKGLCGAAVYSWTDEWSIFTSDIKGWSFGLTTADRTPKPALAAVRDIYSSTVYRLRGASWPKVSVVVAAYNGAATINDTLAWLSRLDYPNYEIIVVDDGSKDGTAAIVKQHGVRAIQVPNGGLSRARNLGIEAAKGEIVAFIDSDAHPDPTWLYYLVCSLEEQNAAAVGGPNIAQRDAGFTADCVDCSPGNPTHVLLNDDHAEHIPGCNMAYRKSVLLEIGMFDPTHRAAGDDVDVCWKLLARGHKIAFSPSALVYHHRRGTVRSYLRQQEGYGYAEAHLQVRYPGRFNFFGHQVWRGHIYDTVSQSLRQHGVPLLFRPKVYQGSFCGEQFQSVYQPFLNWWIQIFTAVEWQGLTAAMLLSGALGTWLGRAAAWVPLSFGLAMLALCFASAFLCAMHASYRKPWRGFRRFRGVLTVAFLHWRQPLARAWGRIRGSWATRNSAEAFPSSARLYGNLLQRAQLLEGLQAHLRTCGWISRPADEWSEYDLEVPGPGPCRLFITTVYEDDVAHAVHYIRYRVTARIKWDAPLVLLSVGVALAVTVLQPWLLPLSMPLVLLSWKFATAKSSMVNGVSQLTLEYANSLGMTRAQDDF
jgi:O-antigen biosynthesis protein